MYVSSPVLLIPGEGDFVSPESIVPAYVKADHQRLLQRLAGAGLIRHQWNIRGADTAVSEIDRGRVFMCRTRQPEPHRHFATFDVLITIMHHRIIQRIDALEILGVEGAGS